MRQVQVIVYCDPCQAWHGSETVEGVETVPVAGGQTLDLCPGHRTDLAPFLALVAEWGATPSSNGGTRKPARAAQAPAEPGKAGKRRGGKRARQRAANAAARGAQDSGALTCPLCQAPSASAQALGKHLGRMHDGLTLTGVYGGQCPLCAAVVTARGLSMHGAQRHGMHTGAPGMFAVALDKGDPYGVVASRAQALADAGSA